MRRDADDYSGPPQKHKVFRSRIAKGDVLKVLKTLSHDVVFDIVIADPPYNIGKDFGTNDDTMPIDDYIDWSEQWLGCCFDRLSDNGVIYVYGFAEILARIAARYPITQQRWLVWHYTNKATPSSRFWQRSHESILCLWKPGKPRPSLEIDQIREPYTKGFTPNIGRVRAATESRFGGKRKKTTIYNAHENGALPRDVIKIPALAGGAGAAQRWFMCHDCDHQVFPPRALSDHRHHHVMKHPTQKPMELTRRLILSRIVGRTGKVLVPFAGSGSECLVAAELGLAYLGIEINPLYVDFAKKWMKHYTKR